MCFCFLKKTATKKQEQQNIASSEKQYNHYYKEAVTMSL